jgi:hypothetical protein
MKSLSDEQLENELSVFSNMKEVGAPNFFYTRLQTRMEKQSMQSGLLLSFKPVWVICILTFFLLINTLLIKKNINVVHTNTNQNIEVLAASYDQNI